MLIFLKYYRGKLARNLNEIGKYIIGQMNSIYSHNELIIFVKTQKLTNTFKSFL